MNQLVFKPEGYRKTRLQNWQSLSLKNMNKFLFPLPNNEALRAVLVNPHKHVPSPESSSAADHGPRRAPRDGAPSTAELLSQPRTHEVAVAQTTLPQSQTRRGALGGTVATAAWTQKPDHETSQLTGVRSMSESERS